MRTPRFLALLILAAAVPMVARAAQVQVTSSTQYLRYSDFLSEETDQQDIAQYLRLNATLDEKGAISVMGYGRILGQLTTSVEPRNGFSDDVIGNLYYLFLDYRDLLPGHLDLRAGRTYVASGALPGIVDGGQLTGRDLGTKGLGVTAFGGRRVFLDNKSEVPFDDDFLWGGSVFFDTVKLTRAEVSYGREYRAGNLAREATALDLTTTPTAMVNLVGRVKYDMVSSRASELLVGAKVAPVERLVLRAEYFDSVPTFDGDSFYRYFDVEHYRQASVGAEYNVGTMARLSAGYAYEKFDADETANLFTVGVALRPMASLFLNASYEHRDGYAGKLGGLRASAGYTYSMATVLAGIDYDDFKRQDSRDGTAKKYWAGLNVDVNKMIAVGLRAERNENFLFDKAYQGFLTVDVHL